MKKRITKLFLCLAACLCCTLFSPVQAEAEEFSPALEVEEYENEEGFHVYEVKEREYDTMEDAARGVGQITRHLMLNRKHQNSKVIVRFAARTTEDGKEYDDGAGEFCDAVQDVLYEEETGNPYGGHFMHQEYKSSYATRIIRGNVKDGYHGSYFQKFEGWTPQEDYEAFQKETAEFVKGLDLDGKTICEKLEILLKWMDENIEYEDDARQRGASSAISAWKYRSGVCVGYADLFYYLGTLSGLDVLYDSGTHEGGHHALNMVKMDDGKYYYIEPQMQLCYYQLKGTEDFPTYVTDDVEKKAKKYNLAKESYWKENSVCKGNHTMDRIIWHIPNGVLMCNHYTIWKCENCDYSYYEWPTDGEHYWEKGRKEVIQKADCEHPEIVKQYCGLNEITNEGLDKNHPPRQVETKPALGHDLTTEVLEATCTEPKQKVTTCNRKGCKYRSVEKLDVEALGHDYQKTETPPTCISPGETVYKCTRCKDTYTEPGAPATGIHSYVLQEIKREPGCDKPGLYHYTCEICRKPHDEYPEPTGHNWVAGKVTPATCEKDETTEYQCSKCQETKTEAKEGTATGHRQFEVLYKTDPTCEEPGHTGVTYCKTCGTAVDDGKGLPALGHSWNMVLIEEPTIEKEGLGEYTCSVCGKKEQRKLPALRHEHGAWEIKIERQPSCKQTGIRRWQCQKCDFHYDIELPKTGHGETIVKGAKKATCKETGYSGDKVCSVCDAVFESGQILDKLEHSFSLEEYNYRPECKEGTKTFKCRSCGETKTETIPPLVKHYWDDGEVTKPASCTEEGEKTYTCHLCKGTRTEAIPKDEGHTWDAGKVTKSATCAKEGEKLYTCGCGETKTEVIPATGKHQWKSTETKPASCTKTGTRFLQCSVCQGEKEETIPKKGHSYGGWETVSKATIFAPAVRKRTCADCRKTEETSYGKKLTAVAAPNATSLKLKTKQSTKSLRITLSAGDAVQSWTSSNAAVAKVTGSANGTCTIKAGKKTGTAKITIATKAGAKTTVTVKVQKGKVTATSIKGVPKSISLKKGATYKLNATVNPITCTDKAKFSSSKKKVATVSGKGVIKAKKAGTAKITVKAGKKKVTCKVTVK